MQAALFSFLSSCIASLSIYMQPFLCRHIRIPYMIIKDVHTPVGGTLFIHIPCKHSVSVCNQMIVYPLALHAAPLGGEISSISRKRVEDNQSMTGYPLPKGST